MRIRFGMLVLLFGLTRIVPAIAEDQTQLFRIISPKDEVVIGVTAAELLKFGAGPALDELARHLSQDGQMTVWQYAVRRDKDGTLRQAPLKRIAVFRADTLRIEPYASALPVVPIAE